MWKEGLQDMGKVRLKDKFACRINLLDQSKPGLIDTSYLSLSLPSCPAGNKGLDAIPPGSKGIVYFVDGDNIVHPGRRSGCRGSGQTSTLDT